MSTNCKANTLFLVIFHLLGLSAISSARPVGPLNLKELVGQSEVIVLGRMVVIHEVTPSQGDGLANRPPARQAEVEVFTTIKGDLDSRHVTVTYDPLYGALGSPAAADTAVHIYFLKKNPDGYSFTSKDYNALPANADVNLVADDPLGQVIAAEGSFVQSPQAELAYKRMALFALGTCKDPRAVRALSESLATASAPALRWEIVVELAGLGDENGLLIASQALAHPPADLTEQTLHNLAVGVRDNARDATLIPSLGGMLKSRDEKTREAAAEALRKIGTQSTLKLLASVLSDEDQQVRYQAVAGLSEITGDRDHHPSMTAFAQDENSYMQYWKVWAAKNQ